MAATKSSCDEVTLLLLTTLGLEEVVLWDFSEARSGDGKQPLKQGCDAAASARDGCIFGSLENWTWSSPPNFKTLT